MAKKSFIVHLDALAIVKEMPPEMAGRFIQAIYDYQSTGQLPEMDFALKMAVAPFINQFTRDESKYDDTCVRNKENARKRWQKSDAKDATGINGMRTMPTNANHADSDNDSDSKNDNDFKGKASPLGFNKMPKAEDVPNPPAAIIQSVRERQYQLGRGLVTEEEVLAHWATWLPVEITGSKFYTDVGAVYRHYVNRCEQITIKPKAQKPSNETQSHLPTIDPKKIAAKYAPNKHN